VTDLDIRYFLFDILQFCIYIIQLVILLRALAKAVNERLRRKLSAAADGGHNVNNISRMKRLIKCRLSTVDTQNTDLCYGYAKLLNQIQGIGPIRQINALNPYIA